MIGAYNQKTYIGDSPAFTISGRYNEKEANSTVGPGTPSYHLNDRTPQTDGDTYSF